MRRPSTRKPATSVSLFPFLAVLVCTMGALIVLLVLVVQLARVQADTITEELKDLNAQHSFCEIVHFMTGYDLCQPVSSGAKKEVGKVKCLALVYQGPDAIKKIRAQLGSTDPSQAAPATVRKEFGQNVMENTAHASDSQENALREMRIVEIEDNQFKKTLKECLK